MIILPFSPIDARKIFSLRSTKVLIDFFLFKSPSNLNSFIKVNIFFFDSSKFLVLFVIFLSGDGIE